jgi:hypothetical protein
MFVGASSGLGNNKIPAAIALEVEPLEMGSHCTPTTIGRYLGAIRNVPAPVRQYLPYAQLAC